MKDLRFIAVIIILLSVIFFPYWLYLPLLGAAIIFFPLFWEAILVALLIDVLYGGGIGRATALFSPMAVLATTLLLVMLPVRERLRVYA